MGEMIIYRYFVAEGEEAEAVKKEAAEEKKEFFARVNKLLEKYAADCAWGGAKSSPAAIGFLHKNGDKPEMKDGFLRPKIERSDRENYAVYYPDRRYKVGKAILEDLKAVGCFNFSDFVTKKLGCYCDCFGILNGQMVRAVAAAGLYGDVVVVSIPTQGDNLKKDITVPPSLREIKKSEFIAITEEGS